MYTSECIENYSVSSARDVCPIRSAPSWQQKKDILACLLVSGKCIKKIAVYLDVGSRMSIGSHEEYEQSHFYFFAVHPFHAMWWQKNHHLTRIRSLLLLLLHHRIYGARFTRSLCVVYTYDATTSQWMYTRAVYSKSICDRLCLRDNENT